MLKPEENRFDYGEQLTPPYINGVQYEFDAAIATTYSLDLDTLLAAPIALCFDETLEGDLRGEKLALLEALGQLKGRLRVFYQKGNIKVPAEYNKLFALLEPCLRAVVPSGGEHASFHPKLWLIRYKESGGKKRSKVIYRLIVLSCNLTFDKSWDIAASLDGKLTTDKITDLGSASWADFFLNLLTEEKDAELKKTFKKELPKIRWSISYGRNPLLLPGGGKFKKPLDIHYSNDSILVVSPFIKDSAGQIKALDWLATIAPEAKRVLVSRAVELNDIGQEKLNSWQCFAINDALVDGAERNELAKEFHDLHAKLIITQRGGTSHWHLGSANATTAALGTVEKAPRNEEFMLRFTGSTAQIGPQSILASWLSGKEGEGLIVPHEFSKLENEIESKDFDFRAVSFPIINADWQLKAKYSTQSEQYELVLSHNISNECLSKILASCDIKIGQLGIPGVYKCISSELHWHGVELSAISALIPVCLSPKCESNSQQKNLIIQVKLHIEGGDNRDKKVLSELLNNEDKLLNYVRLLLSPYSTKEEWLDISKRATGVGGSEGTNLFDSTPIYEQLMLAAARNPSALNRIQALLERLETTEVKIPEQFLSLWQHFEKEVVYE
ncbi:phospholipase D family protein [Pseudoalteromonas phenolica]|uniref:phospholipase D family protein n=1 Tax=Pseudoalteromonas phenolica TaxID=161398 RepID=UPI00110A632B|nr:phospholipase D family protein [Pseudoalteromonas phenolica]TMO53741.1 hypothetical protein CWC21_18310 [Pseudoalteromonas phenolica]